MTSTLPPTPGRRRTAGRIALWTAVATIGALGVTGVALAAPSFTQASNSTATATPSAGSSAQPGGKADRHGKRHPGMFRLGRLSHGEAVVQGKDGKFLTVYTQRGAVTAVSAKSITLKSADGYTASYAVTGDTKVGKDGKPAKIGDIKVGDQAGVMAQKSGDSKTARGIRVGDKHPQAKTNN
ncbi:MAG: hypothetical protein WCB04_03830 [Mycobacteriales bacterium]